MFFFLVIVPTIDNREKLCIRVCFIFFLFSTQNQVPQIIIGLGRVVYHIKALSVVIRMSSQKKLKKFPSVEKNWFEIFDFSS